MATKTQHYKYKDIALIKAKLRPYIVFSILYNIELQLFCDFMELYRYLINDFLIQSYKKIGKNHFVVKNESMTRKKVGKREYARAITRKESRNYLMVNDGKARSWKSI